MPYGVMVFICPDPCNLAFEGLRETKAFAARRGLSLRQVIVEALAQKLRVEQATPESKPWLQAFQGIERDQVLRQELLRLRRNIEAEFEQVNPEEWR
jgi:hypothetical protein